MYYYNHAMSFLAMHYNDGVSLLKSDYRLEEWGLLVPHEVEDAYHLHLKRGMGVVITYIHLKREGWWFMVEKGEWSERYY